MTDDNSIMSFLQGVNSRGGNNDIWGCGGFGILIILFFLMFGGWGNGFGRGNMGAANNITEFDALLSGQNQIKNQMGYDNIQSDVRGLERGMCSSTYELNNSVNGGFSSVQSALCQGFNGIDRAISDIRFDLSEKMGRIAADNNIQLQGIRSAIQECCCGIKKEIASNAQRILDRMCSNEQQALRDVIFKQSQELQTASIVAQLKATTPAAA